MSKTVYGEPHNLLGYLKCPPPFPVHLVQDLIVKEGTYGMIFGEASSAKSLIAQALMVSLATGEKFAGHFQISGGPRKVMFLDLDQGADTSLRRFAKLCNWPEFKEDDGEEGLLDIVAENITHYSPRSVSFLASIMDQDGSLKAAEYCVGLWEILNENMIDVLVIDCLVRTLGGEEENSSSTANRYFQIIKLLQDASLEKGRLLTVIILSHARKAVVQTGGGKTPAHDDMRGASGWRDSLDFQIKAYKKGDVVNLTKLKDRNSENPDQKFQFRVIDNPDANGDNRSVRFQYEPGAELTNQSDLLWSELSQITGGDQNKGVKLGNLADILKAGFAKGLPHSTMGLRPILYHLCEVGRAQCSVQEFKSKNPHKVFWNVGG